MNNTYFRFAAIARRILGLRSTKKIDPKHKAKLQHRLAYHFELTAFIKRRSREMRLDKIRQSTEYRNDFRREVAREHGVNYRRVVLHAPLSHYLLAKKGKFMSTVAPMIVIKNKTGRNTIINYGTVRG